MKHYLKMTRPFDYVIVIALLVASFIPYVVFAHEEASKPKPQQVVYTAVVTHDGKEVYHIRLTGHKGRTTFVYHDGDDENTIVTTGNKIAITEANCKDQICVRKGQIAKPGQTIVCLPHKLLVQINSNSHSSGNNTGGMVSE
ncbi:NusG domain II-containing protein [Lacticaseibacillus jixiensis]|uniref:NusG domain II-containing protein n=1 Tax=Lacticaseibacillus jixiensis TaxID=3231926 RepID=UPI0036F36446